MVNEIWYKGKKYGDGGVGLNTTGTEYTIDGTEYTADQGAEIFNDYVNNKAAGLNSHAEGESNTVLANDGHAEGRYNTITNNGYQGHAEGYSNTVNGSSAHAEGSGNTVSGNLAHVEGNNNTITAQGTAAHAEGFNGLIDGTAGHVEGQDGVITGNYSHVGGMGCATSGYENEATGKNSLALGEKAHAEGEKTLSWGTATHAEGSETVAYGNYPHSEGRSTFAVGSSAHAEGQDTFAGQDYSHAEGNRTFSLGYSSHTEGYGEIKNLILTPTNTTKVYNYSGMTPSVGDKIFLREKINDYSDNTLERNYPEGYTKVIERLNNSSYTSTVYRYVEAAIIDAVESNTVTLNNNIGDSGPYYCYILTGLATGMAAHTEGMNNQALGNSAHAEGYSTKAIGDYSHAGGTHTVAKGSNQTVIGKNNIVDDNNTYAFIIGNGTNSTNLSNAFAIDWDGVIYGTQSTSLSMKSAANITIDSGFRLKGSGGGEITIGDMQNNKSIYISAMGNTFSLSNGSYFTMNGGANINIQNGGSVSVREGSRLDLTDGTSIFGDTDKISIKINGSTVDFTYADLLKLKELIDEGPQAEKTVGQTTGLLDGTTTATTGTSEEVEE